MSNIYANAARLLFTNDSDNIDIVCCQEWVDDEKELIWEEYFKLMNETMPIYKELKFFSISSLQEIHDKSAETFIEFTNWNIKMYWNTDLYDNVGHISSNVPLKKGVYFRENISEFYTDALSSFKKIIIQSL